MKRQLHCVVCGCTERHRCPGGCALIAWHRDSAGGLCDSCAQVICNHPRTIAAAARRSLAAHRAWDTRRRMGWKARR